MDDFKTLINDNSKIPENPDEAFITKYFVDESGEVLKFCVLISTPKLLEISSRARRGLVLVVRRHIPNQHGGGPGHLVWRKHIRNWQEV